MRQATQPRYTDHRQRFLESLARGRCSAVSETVGAQVRYFPAINYERVSDPEIPGNGFDNAPTAKAAAVQFQMTCREKLAEANGRV